MSIHDDDDRERARQEGQAYAIALLNKVAEIARTNAAVVAQNQALIDQLKHQQAALERQQGEIRALCQRVEELGGTVEVVAQAALTDDEIDAGHARAAAAGFGRQVMQGLFGAWRPGMPQPQPPFTHGPHVAPGPVPPWARGPMR